MSPAGAAHCTVASPRRPFGQPLRILDQLQQGIPGRAAVPGRHEDAGDAIDDELRGPADATDDCRQPSRHALVHRDRRGVERAPVANTSMAPSTSPTSPAYDVSTTRSASPRSGGQPAPTRPGKPCPPQTRRAESGPPAVRCGCAGQRGADLVALPWDHPRDLANDGRIGRDAEFALHVRAASAPRRAARNSVRDDVERRRPEPAPSRYSPIVASASLTRASTPANVSSPATHNGPARHLFGEYPVETTAGTPATVPRSHQTACRPQAARRPHRCGGSRKYSTERLTSLTELPVKPERRRARDRWGRCRRARTSTPRTATSTPSSR